MGTGMVHDKNPWDNFYPKKPRTIVSGSDYFITNQTKGAYSMQDVVKINAVAVTGTPLLMSTQDGEKLRDVLYDNLSNGNRVELSFAGADTIIAHFLNVSIGELYMDIKDWDMIDTHITFTDIAEDDLDLLLVKIIPTNKNLLKMNNF